MSKILQIAVFIILFIPKTVLACELCALYNSIDNRERRAGDLLLGLAYQYQFSDSSTRPIGFNADKQELQSYILQNVANYNFTESFGVQANLPLIYREYRRFENGANSSGSEKGIGDASILLKYAPWQKFTGRHNYRLEFFSGLKLPTGDSDRLKEEAGELDTRSLLRHSSIDGNLIGGDDLTLGSGSYDFLLGTSFFTQYSRFNLAGSVQYSIRTEGDYDYRFGNDIQWYISPGAYVYLDHDYTVALRTRLSGEYKRKDKLAGLTLADSDENNLYLGPELAVSIGNKLVFKLAADFAIKNDDSSREITSKKRMLTSLTYIF